MPMSMPPILVADLFPELTRRLLSLLRALTPDEWHLPTISSQRTVKDIASHLIDGSLRRLSMQRDNYCSVSDGSRPQPGESLMDFLNRLNREWEVGTHRLSPNVLIELIEWADIQLAEFVSSLDPYGPAIFPVAWAGEEHSQNWMDVAREFTEKWHHTQQIFEATGRVSTILDRHLGHPCLDIFMRALPYTFRYANAPVGSTVAVSVSGEAGGSWYVERAARGWQQVADLHREATARVVLDQNAAWKLVTKRRSRAAALERFPEIEFHGNRALGSYLLTMLSVMA
jgi:hypothetical protein